MGRARSRDPARLRAERSLGFRYSSSKHTSRARNLQPHSAMPRCRAASVRSLEQLDARDRRQAEAPMRAGSARCGFGIFETYATRVNRSCTFPHTPVALDAVIVMFTLEPVVGIPSIVCDPRSAGAPASICQVLGAWWQAPGAITAALPVRLRREIERDKHVLVALCDRGNLRKRIVRAHPAFRKIKCIADHVARAHFSADNRSE